VESGDYCVGLLYLDKTTRVESTADRPLDRIWTSLRLRFYRLVKTGSVCCRSVRSWGFKAHHHGALGLR